MKKILVSMLVLAFLAAACLPTPAPTNPAPTVDVQATIDSVVKTALAETLTAQPTATVAPPTDTATQEASDTPTSEAPSDTPGPNLTTTPVTATAGTMEPATSTTTLSAPGELTFTPTLGVLIWGTLPPAVPSAKITIYNKSRLQAYISLQNDPPQQIAILEYPVKRQVSIKAPIGYYIYVVWVGGRKITGDFTLHKDDMLTITIYKDKVEIK